jgi:hypothetical protein
MTTIPPWTPPQLDTYVRIALSRMADNRDVMTDSSGQPIFQIFGCDERPDGSLRIDLKADLSGIGMPTNAPLRVIAEPNGPVSWFLGKTLIAALPGDWMPEEAGDALDMDKLLAAHRNWVRDAAKGGGKLR